MTDIPQTDWVYDIETYYDLFCVDVTHIATRTRFIFEVSDRRDQSAEFIRHIYWLRQIGARMFGFNNEGFDWPVVQTMIGRGQFTALDAHNKGTEIITSNNRFGSIIWPDQRIVTQGDLFKIHHFDNMNRSTSLKKLEFNMRAGSIIDLPYPPDQQTTSAQKDEIIAYMCHDVSETLRFYHASLDQIKFRDELAVKYPDMGDVLNMNDTKIGKKFFEMQLERAGTPCYHRPNGRREPRQTWRTQIAIKDVISPIVQFSHPEFQRVKSWLEQQILTREMIDDSLSETVETKGVFKGVSADVAGMKYVFGTGGIHGSISSATVSADDEFEIWDWDVKSYYPNLAITNRFFPAHLSETFCDVYKTVYDMRREYGKGAVENKMLKDALNGVYGDSNNKYGPFYDPQYTMSITVNGQLMLCMLAEWLTVASDDLTVIQINTDGLTVRIRKSLVDWMKQTCDHWMKVTGLELEPAQYSRMWIRDVNNYIAEKTSGELKRKGDYCYETALENRATQEKPWHKDQSALVVPKAVEAHMVRGESIEQFIMNHRDPFDFQLMAKVDRKSSLLHGESPIQRTSRYYVSTDGAPLVKLMQPLKGKTELRRIGIQIGWNVSITNDIESFKWSNVNWLYYIEQAKQLVVK